MKSLLPKAILAGLGGLALTGLASPQPRVRTRISLRRSRSRRTGHSTPASPPWPIRPGTGTPAPCSSR